MAFAGPFRQAQAMQVIRAPRRPGSTVSMIPILAGFLVGAALLFAGVTLAALAFGTSFAERLMSPRPGITQTLAGVLAWTLALIAPGALVIIGLARIGGDAGSRPKIATSS